MKRRLFLLGSGLLVALPRFAAAQADMMKLYSVPMLAARRQWDGAFALIQQGRSPDETDESGETAMGYAAQFGDLQMVQALLYFRARVDIADKFGNTPLYWASERGSVDVMQALIDAKATIDAANRQGITPLITAAGHSQVRAVRLLLKYGADPKKADFTGRDALGWAEGKPNVLQALRGRGGG